MDIIFNITKDVLASLYQQFGAAITLAFLFMFFYQEMKEDGLKETICLWFKRLKEDRYFRRVFILAFYIAMILFRTLFCRSIFPNPLQNVLGIWGLHNANGTLYTENIENFILFLPFTVLFFWATKDKLICITVRYILLKAAYISFLFSLSIELCQFFFKLGTLQLTDLVFNTGGGISGGFLYYTAYRWKHRHKKIQGN